MTDEELAPDDGIRALARYLAETPSTCLAPGCHEEATVPVTSRVWKGSGKATGWYCAFHSQPTARLTFACPACGATISHEVAYDDAKGQAASFRSVVTCPSCGQSATIEGGWE